MNLQSDLPQGYTPDQFNTEIEIAAGRNIPGRAIDLYVMGRQRFGAKRTSVMATPTFTTYENENDAIGMLREPTLTLSLESAQRLMDELWRCGVRPTEEGTAGQVAAMQAHLQDMRKLVFDFIGKPPIVHYNAEKRAADDAIIEREFGKRKE